MNFHILITKKISLPHPDSIQKIIVVVIMIMINRRLLNPENFWRIIWLLIIIIIPLSTK